MSKCVENPLVFHIVGKSVEMLDIISIIHRMIIVQSIYPTDKHYKRIELNL